MERPIVVIESNKDSRTVFEIMFRQGHIQNPVIMLAGGQEAMDYFTAEHDAPVLILLDAKLVDVTAINVLHFIRATPQVATCRVMVLRDEDLITGLDTPEMQPVTIVRKYDNAMTLERFLRGLIDLHAGLTVNEPREA